MCFQYKCHLKLFLNPIRSTKILDLVQGETDVIFRWYTRPEDSDNSSFRVPVCGIEGANCQEEPSAAGLLGTNTPLTSN